MIYLYINILYSREIMLGVFKLYIECLSHRLIIDRPRISEKYI